MRWQVPKLLMLAGSQAEYFGRFLKRYGFEVPKVAVCCWQVPKKIHGVKVPKVAMLAGS